MTLNDYLAEATVDEETIRDRIDTLASAGYASSAIARAISDESRLPEHVWCDLCESLEQTSNDTTDIRDSVKQWARKNDHALAGPLADCLASDTIFAYCVTARELANALVKRSDARTWKDVHRWLKRSVRNDEALRKQREDLGPVQLKRFSPMWATFHREDPTDNPREDLPDTCKKVHACLALAGPAPTDILVILRYQLPLHAPPHYPTVASACCPENWNARWKPAPAQQDDNECYGWTNPPDTGVDDPLEPRPEVVHKVVSADTLTHRIESIE